MMRFALAASCAVSWFGAAWTLATIPGLPGVLGFVACCTFGFLFEREIHRGRGEAAE